MVFRFDMTLDRLTIFVDCSSGQNFPRRTAAINRIRVDFRSKYSTPFPQHHATQSDEDDQERSPEDSPIQKQSDSNTNKNANQGN